MSLFDGSLKKEDRSTNPRFIALSKDLGEVEKKNRYFTEDNLDRLKSLTPYRQYNLESKHAKVALDIYDLKRGDGKRVLIDEERSIRSRCGDGINPDQVIIYLEVFFDCNMR